MEKGSFVEGYFMAAYIKYRGIAICNPGIGDTISFWDDLIHGNVMSLKYPSFMSLQKKL